MSTLNFFNANGETYNIICQNKELDRTLLSIYSEKLDSILYIVAWGLDFETHTWAQGHYFMKDFNAACDYLNGREDEVEVPKHWIPIKDFLNTLSKDTQIAIYDTGRDEWVAGLEYCYDTVGFWDWSSLPDDKYVEKVELHYDTDAGDGLWIDVSSKPYI